MQTTTIENAFTGEFLSDAALTASAKISSPQHDIAEIAIGFGRQYSSRPGQDFRTATIGEITFRRVDPLREPFQVADRRLQDRLEALSEALRAKY